MTTISATKVAHSKHAITGKEICTLLLRYPRAIHAEFMTHRQFSRNASSSRAIPVSKLIKDVLDDPFVPLHWGKNQKGMQATEECTALITRKDRPFGENFTNREAWLDAMLQAVQWAQAFDEAGYHKQIVNRLLEPFSHITVVVTATEWSNFFALRDHPDAEPHIRRLAQVMKIAMEASEPKILQPGEWHLPFADSDEDSAKAWSYANGDTGGAGPLDVEVWLDALVKLSVARCASTSYKTVDGFDMMVERAVDLHDKLVASTPLHASPCEHQAYADEVIEKFGSGFIGYQNENLHGNFVGFCQYRKTLPMECL